MELRDLLPRMVTHDPILLKLSSNYFLSCGLSLRRFGCGDDDRDHGCGGNGFVVDESIACAEAIAF